MFNATNNFSNENFKNSLNEAKEISNNYYIKEIGEKPIIIYKETLDDKMSAEINIVIKNSAKQKL